MISTPAAGRFEPVLVPEPGARQARLVDEESFGLQGDDPKLHPAAAAKLDPHGLPGGELALELSRLELVVPVRPAGGVAPQRPDAPPGWRSFARCDWPRTPECAYDGSGEPAKAKNQISIAMVAITAVATNTVSIGVSSPLPGR